MHAGAFERRASTGASIIGKFSHATSGADVPNVPGGCHKTAQEYEKQNMQSCSERAGALRQ